MAVQSVSGAAGSYEVYSAASKNEAAAKKEKAASTDSSKAAESSKSSSSGVVYESSTDITKMSKSERSALVNQLKADQEARKSQLTSLVMDMIGKQGKTFAIAQDEDSIWKFLAEGNFEVDAKTKAEAEEAISEDGYWGIEQTSQRIFDFALALSGGDDEKMSQMLDAFEKGFKEATGAWGKDLPDISQKTREAVYDKFDQYKNRNNVDEAQA